MNSRSKCDPMSRHESPSGAAGLPPARNSVKDQSSPAIAPGFCVPSKTINARFRLDSTVTADFESVAARNLPDCMFTRVPGAPERDRSNSQAGAHVLFVSKLASTTPYWPGIE